MTSGGSRGGPSWHLVTALVAFAGGALIYHLVATAQRPGRPVVTNSIPSQSSAEPAAADRVLPVPRVDQGSAGLTRWVGRYPTETLDGSDFFADPEVRRALDASLTAGDIDLLRSYATVMPIETIEAYLWVNVCKPHDCPTDATLAINLSSGQVFSLIARDGSREWVHPGGRDELRSPMGTHLVALMRASGIPESVRNKFWSKFAPAEGGPTLLQHLPTPAPRDSGECRDLRVSVDGRKWWQSTGVTLSAGETASITAGGTWGQANKPVGPDGDSAFVVQGPCSGVATSDCFPVWNRPALLLVGRVGESGPPFAIGRSASIRATAHGDLQLAPNDRRDILWDNFGSLSVQVIACAERQASTDIGAAPSDTTAADDQFDKAAPCAPIDLTPISDIARLVTEEGLPGPVVSAAREAGITVGRVSGHPFDLDGDGRDEYLVWNLAASGASGPGYVALFVGGDDRWRLVAPEIPEPYVRSGAVDGSFYGRTRGLVPGATRGSVWAGFRRRYKLRGNNLERTGPWCREVR